MMQSWAHSSSADKQRWPDGLDPRTICLTVDVEWAAEPVLADVQRLFDERGLRATFFCTHPGINVGQHERGLHPNYRRNGDTVRKLTENLGEMASRLDEIELYRHVLSTTRSFAPEAKGVRNHSLYYDSSLMPLYREFGLQYDSSYQIPLVTGLQPFWKEYDVLELPIFFADHFELKTGACCFDAGRLPLDQPGLKVINLHPNMIFLNCNSDEQYLASKSFYRDPERLLAARKPERGVRTLVIDILERIKREALPCATLGEVSIHWRTLAKWD